MPSSTSAASNDSGEKPASRTSARDRDRDSLVRAFYAAVLLALLAVTAYGEGVNPLLAAALGVGLVFCWVSWPAYRESIER